MTSPCATCTERSRQLSSIRGDLEQSRRHLQEEVWRHKFTTDCYSKQNDELSSKVEALHRRVAEVEEEKARRMTEELRKNVVLCMWVMMLQKKVAKAEEEKATRAGVERKMEAKRRMEEDTRLRDAREAEINALKYGLFFTIFVCLITFAFDMFP